MDWLTAIFGLLGVVVGGAITTGGTVWLQRRAEAREEAAEANRREATVSLLHSTLEHLLGFLGALERQQEWYAPPSEYWLTVWQDRSPTLASLVGRDDFETTASAFLVVYLVNWQTTGPRRKFSPKDQALVAAWKQMVDKGIKTLERLSPPPA